MDIIQGEFVKVVFSLGSNIGDRLHYLRQAANGLEACGKIESVSSVVESEPWGYDDSMPYLNAVLVLKTNWKPDQIYRLAAKIEVEAGRRRTKSKGYSSRTLDIDVLYYDGQKVLTEMLEIPHPRMHLRNFVLEPLAEIEPDFRHPLLDKTSEELLENSSDTSSVSYFSDFYDQKL